MYGLIAVSYANSVSFGNLLIALAVALLAVPTTMLAMQTLRANKQAQEARQIGLVVKEILAGKGDVPERSPDNPSLSDLLTSIEENTRDTADVSKALGFHVRDGHGGPIPTAIRRRSTPPDRRRRSGGQ